MLLGGSGRAGLGSWHPHLAPAVGWRSQSGEGLSAPPRKWAGAKAAPPPGGSRHPQASWPRVRILQEIRGLFAEWLLSGFALWLTFVGLIGSFLV